MTSWLDTTKFRDEPDPEQQGKYFAPRRVGNKVKSRRVTAPSRSVMIKRHRIKRARGIPTAPVPAQPVREHIESLLAGGMNMAMIAAAAGCSDQGIRLILFGEHERVYRSTAEQIMNVTFTPTPHQRWVLSVGAVRRLRALRAIGWSVEAIAEQLGEETATISNVGRFPTMTYARWKQIADLYQQLGGTLGPSDRARNWAARRGWASPIAWDGIDIDHPDSVPDLGCALESDDDDDVRLARILAGEFDGVPTKAEKYAVYDHAIEHGWLPAKVAERLGMTQEAAERAILRRKAKLRKQEAA